MTSSENTLSAGEIQEKLAEHHSYTKSQGSRGQRLDLSHYVIKDFCFDGLDLCDVVAQGTLFKNCSFKKVNWSGGNFDSTSAEACNFDEGIFVKAEFFEAKLAKSTFAGANLNRAEFIECDLTSVNFKNAQMSGAVVSESNISGADFEGAQRETASFDGNQS